MDEQLALEACQCLWEAALEKMDAYPSCPLAKYREQYGSIPLRHAMRQQTILEACSSGWKKMTEEQRQAHLPFDFEYCPIFLDKCLTISSDSISLRPDWETSLKGTTPQSTLVQSCHVDELCAGKPLAEVWPSDASAGDAARTLLSQIDTTKVRLIGSPSDLVDCLLNIAERDFRENKGVSLCQVHKQALVDHGQVDQSEMDDAEPEVDMRRRRPKM